MDYKMLCDYCAVRKVCRERLLSNGCDHDVAVPRCKNCEFCESIVEEISQTEYFFCKRNNREIVSPMGFCSYGILKEQTVTGSRETAEGTLNTTLGKVNIYTDGACKGNPGPGGWGSIVVFSDGTELVIGGGEQNTTNNRMELTAVIEALRVLKDECDVTLTTDSQYVVDSITKRRVYNWKKNGWKKSDGKTALNVDLWEKLLTLLVKHKVSFVWVKGHAGHPYNERCDSIACKHAAKFC